MSMDGNGGNSEQGFSNDHLHTTIPSAMSRRAISARLQRAYGIPLSRGRLQASAVT